MHQVYIVFDGKIIRRQKQNAEDDGANATWRAKLYDYR